MPKDIAHGSLNDYIGIARPDHWIKNVFMLPGAALAFVIDDQVGTAALLDLPLAVASTCLVASANYTINEYLDAAFDRHHPTKRERASAQGRIRPDLVLAQYVALATAGLGLAALLNPVFLLASLALLLMGILYNVEPVRTKDRAYLDVLSESINNPIRLVLGWAAVTSLVLPPASMMLSYWMGGAYLMAIKRFAEYRLINDPLRAGLYRRSFQRYTEDSLFLSAFFYAMTAALFLGIFLVKYRVEFVLSFPFFALLFVWYQRISLKPASTAVNPEKLHLEPLFLCYVAFLGVVVCALFFIDIPQMAYLTDHSVTSDLRVE